MWSLADLCDELLHLQLRKPSLLRTGSWEKRPLSVDQLFYAAADAYAGMRLWQVRSIFFGRQVTSGLCAHVHGSLGPYKYHKHASPVPLRSFCTSARHPLEAKEHLRAALNLI